jgi:hypothetical protein
MSNALRLAEDRFVVANGGATDLRYYDAQGQHLATIGRQGEGPGEFRSLSALMRGPADTLIVYDNQARRFSVISPEPAFVRDFRFNDAGIVSLVIGRTSTGNFVTVPTSVRGSPDEFPSGLIRPEQVVTVHSADGMSLDTVGTFLGAERIVNIRQRNGEIVSIEISAPPFARTSTYVLSGDGLWVATQDGPEITRYRLDGTPELSIRTGRQPVPVTPEHIDALIEARLENAPPETRRCRIRSSFHRTDRCSRTHRIDCGSRTMRTRSHRRDATRCTARTVVFLLESCCRSTSVRTTLARIGFSAVSWMNSMSSTYACIASCDEYLFTLNPYACFCCRWNRCTRKSTHSAAG